VFKRFWGASQIANFVNEGLGHSSYLMDLGDGTALVLDPARIPTARVACAAERGLRIAYTADTHTHADYISGSPDLAAHARPSWRRPLTSCWA
jgi:glyoxylase-like metal-dependent hydrolase (beta-lactamase superfamily II)